MTVAIFLVLAAALALVVILRVAVSGSLQISRDTSLASQIQPLDIVAFRNLIDPGEDRHLRHHLPAADFRAVQRNRLRAMAAYIQAAGRNAEILVRIGQGALVSPDHHTAEAGRQLVNDALWLRRNAAFALLRIYIALAWPKSGLAAASVLDRYQQLNGSAMLLGRLQNPASPLRISAG
jgi:hypothetical protein